jgi:hypothetical protein
VNLAIGGVGFGVEFLWFALREDGAPERLELAGGLRLFSRNRKSTVLSG